jgi:hypothetical protein
VSESAPPADQRRRDEEAQARRGEQKDPFDPALQEMQRKFLRIVKALSVPT